MSDRVLRECKFFPLVEIDVFSDEREARAWPPEGDRPEQLPEGQG